MKDDDLESRLDFSLRKLSESIGPRVYGTRGADDGAAFITSFMKSRDIEVESEHIKVPSLLDRGTEFSLEKPLKLEIACRPFYGFAPFFLCPQKTPPRGISGELKHFDPALPDEVVTDKIVVLEAGLFASLVWDIIFIEEKKPLAIVVISGEPSSQELHCGSREALMDVYGMPLLNENIPKIMIARDDGEELLRILGDAPFAQGRIISSTEVRPQSITNVAAKIPGSSGSGKEILIWAHYDTAWESPCSPGANDNASSVAIALELARYFKKAPLKNDILFLFAGAEECSGMSGLSRVFDTGWFWEDEKRILSLFLITRAIFEGKQRVGKAFRSSYLYRKKINFEQIRKVRVALELETLGKGERLIIGTPRNSLIAKVIKRLPGKLLEVLDFHDMAGGLETQWYHHLDETPVAVIARNDNTYPYHSPRDVPHRIDLDAMRESFSFLTALIREIDPFI